MKRKRQAGVGSEGLKGGGCALLAAVAAAAGSLAEGWLCARRLR